MANNDPMQPPDEKQEPTEEQADSSTEDEQEKKPVAAVAPEEKQEPSEEQADTSAVDQQEMIPVAAVAPEEKQEPTEEQADTSAADQQEMIPVAAVAPEEKQEPTEEQVDTSAADQQQIRSVTSVVPRHVSGNLSPLNGQVAKPSKVTLQPASPGKPTRPGVAPVVSVRNVKKTYTLGQTRVHALRGVSLDVYPGEFVAVMGPSGSGKSTFMNLLGCLDRPTDGEYWLAGRLVSSLNSDELADIRNRLIGFVFQGFNLLNRASALSNVALPMLYAGMSKEEREERARRVLKLVGLGSRMHHKPAQLSGGQQQRVAIARSLVNGPSILLADEPTGNLDSRTSVEIIAILQALNQQGLTIILVTHEPDIASYTKRLVSFRDGRVIQDEPNPHPRSAVDEWTNLAKKKSGSLKGNVKVKEETK
jgi:putative ABC transport system ATP-binding protein